MKQYYSLRIAIFIAVVLSTNILALDNGRIDSIIVRRDSSQTDTIYLVHSALLKMLTISVDSIIHDTFYVADQEAFKNIIQEDAGKYGLKETSGRFNRALLMSKHELQQWQIGFSVLTGGPDNEYFLQRWFNPRMAIGLSYSEKASVDIGAVGYDNYLFYLQYNTITYKNIFKTAVGGGVVLSSKYFRYIQHHVIDNYSYDVDGQTSFHGTGFDFHAVGALNIYSMISIGLNMGFNVINYKASPYQYNGEQGSLDLTPYLGLQLIVGHF